MNWKRDTAVLTLALVGCASTSTEVIQPYVAGSTRFVRSDTAPFAAGSKATFLHDPRASDGSFFEVKIPKGEGISRVEVYSGAPAKGASVGTENELDRIAARSPGKPSESVVFSAFEDREDAPLALGQSVALFLRVNYVDDNGDKRTAWLVPTEDVTVVENKDIAWNFVINQDGGD